MATKFKSKVIDNDQTRDAVFTWLTKQPYPYTLSVVPGAIRTSMQNKLQRLWCKEVAEQRKEDTPEQIRGFCKLHFGVPILNRDNEAFKATYYELFRPLPYELKLAFMMEPYDFAVTRHMTRNQIGEYLDEIYRHYTNLGVELTMPKKGG